MLGFSSCCLSKFNLPKINGKIMPLTVLSCFSGKVNVSFVFVDPLKQI